MDLLKSKGLPPKLQRLNNEASKLLREHMTSKGVDFQVIVFIDAMQRNAPFKLSRTISSQAIAPLIRPFH